ncbi:MAG TPA: TetR/AcrR family transcriptional regulator [Gemmatimonadota bacterium]|nr:TetR/AcrR family transcriptional regulator [Gemmatimonadota bacterium]
MDDDRVSAPAAEPDGSPLAEAGPPGLPELGDTEAAIYEATRDILAEGGLEALSMRALAARVGTTPTAIYHYFQNKDELVQRVVVRGFREFESRLRGAIDDHPVGSLDRLAAIGEAYLKFAIEHEQYFKITFGIQAGCPRELDDMPARGGYDLLKQSVVDAMEAGTIRQGDPDMVALYLWSIVHGLVTIFMACECESLLEDTAIRVPEGAAPVGHLFQQFRAFVENGLLPT